MPFDTTPSNYQAITLDRDNFRHWLKANKNKIVGKVNHPLFCPIASYLSTTYGCTFSVTKFIKSRDVVIMPTPDWAAIFIDQIDSYKASCVTGKIALKCLRRKPQ